MAEIISNKYYREESVFLPENLLREARRQKNLKDCRIPSVCLLDPDGDLADYLARERLSVKNSCCACYHSSLYSFQLGGMELGIIPCVVGAPYAVLVAEQLFVSGCELLISITSAGIINKSHFDKRFALITTAIRDEGTSYHYMSPDESSEINEELRLKLCLTDKLMDSPYFEAMSWTTDAPYRETQTSIGQMQKLNAACVEMEASALYALSRVKGYSIICFAHLTNSMAQNEGDFEKGDEMGSVDTLNLIKYVLNLLNPKKLN